ncbi:hypothetical protein MMC11_006094 [Xylographa trunciseda]|nr:hypothetical protein [Xylographa trunciseda]
MDIVVTTSASSIVSRRFQKKNNQIANHPHHKLAMPLWRIYSNPSTFTPAEKAALAADIVPLYVGAGLPGFFVNVLFIAVDEESFYISGKPNKTFVRISIEHIAIHQPKVEEDGAKIRVWMCDMIDNILKPHIAARGDLDWEYNVYETPRDLWKTNGIGAPENGSKEMKIWQGENKPLAWANGELHSKI